MAQPIRTIPMPLRVRFLQFRRRALPGLFFVVCLALTLWLWQRQELRMTMRGQVEAVKIVVSATSDGMLAALPNQITVFDRVLANATIVAQLDVTPILVEIEILRAERERLEAQLSAERSRLQMEQQRFAFDQQRIEGDQRQQIAQLRQELTEFQVLRNQLALRRLDAISDQAVANQEMNRLEDRIEHTRLLVDKDMSSSFSLQDVLNELAVQESRKEASEEALEAIGKQIEQAVAGIEQAEQRLNEAMTNADGVVEDGLADADSANQTLANVAAILAPLERAVEVQKLRVKDLVERMERLEIRAPVTGTIAAVHRQPGTWVRMGDPLVTIAENRADYIVAYLRASAPRNVEPDMPVSVLVGNVNKSRFRARIRQVGTQYEPIPEYYLGQGAAAEWGLPIQVSLPEDARVLPGEFVEVVLLSTDDDAA